jgi:hypothetical protein
MIENRKSFIGYSIPIGMARDKEGVWTSYIEEDDALREKGRKRYIGM